MNLQSIDTVKSSHLSSLQMKNPIETKEIYDKSPIVNIPAELKMDFSPMIGKPFHLATFGWGNASAAGAIIATLGFPTTLLNLNHIATSPFDLASLYNLKACLVIQVSGTPMHSGSLIVAALPLEFPDLTHGAGTVHQYQTAPHAFLHASSANVACLEIPWYSTTKLRYTPSVNVSQDVLSLSNTSLSVTTLTSNVDYARVFFEVVSPLGVPTSGVTTVNVTVSVMFKEMNFYVPKAEYVSQSKASSLVTHGLDSFAKAAKAFTGDAIDASRAWLRDMIGLHNPNIRVPSMRGVMAMRNNPNYVDKETYYYKLDPYAQHMTPMLEYEGDTDKDEGLVINMCRKKMIVSIFPVTTTTAAGTVLFSAPIHPMMFRTLNTAQSGALISAPMEKLARMARFWSGSLVLTVHNMGSAFHMFKLLVTREYLGSTQMLRSANYPTMQSLQNNACDVLEFSNGGQTLEVKLPMASMFDHIPISPDSLTNNILHGRVMIYLLQPMVTNGAVPVSIDVAVHVSAGDDFCLYGYSGDYFTQSSEAPVFVSDSSNLVNSGDQLPNQPRLTDFRPFVHVRDVVRRIIPCIPITITTELIESNVAVANIDIADLIFNNTAAKNAISCITSMFYGFRGGVKMKILIKGCSDAVVNYFPPVPIAINTTATLNSQIRLTAGSVVNSLDPTQKALQLARVSSFRNSNAVYNGPYLESADHRDPHTSLDQVGTTAAGPLTTDTNASLCVFEFEIPWMNACRFITTASSVNGQEASYSQMYQNVLGNLTVGLNSIYSEELNTGGDIPNPIRIYPFIGFDDTARLLYQAVSIPYSLPVITGSNQDSNWNSPSGQLVPATYNYTGNTKYSTGGLVI